MSCDYTVWGMYLYEQVSSCALKPYPPNIMTHYTVGKRDTFTGSVYARCQQQPCKAYTAQNIATELALQTKHGVQIIPLQPLATFALLGLTCFYCSTDNCTVVAYNCLLTFSSTIVDRNTAGCMECNACLAACKRAVNSGAGKRTL